MKKAVVGAGALLQVALSVAALCLVALLWPRAGAAVGEAAPARAAFDDRLVVTLALDPTSGWPGGPSATATITVSQTITDTPFSLELRLETDPLVLGEYRGCDTVTATGCRLDEMPYLTNETVTATFSVPAGTPPGSYPLTVVATAPNPDDFQVELLTVPAGAVRLAPIETLASSAFEVRGLGEFTVTPRVAKQGDVVTVVATALPPGPVTLRWSAGATPQHPFETMGGDPATGRWLVVIPRHDRLGPRDLIVGSATGAFAEVTVPAALLVVPPSTDAPRFVGRG